MIFFKRIGESLQTPFLLLVRMFFGFLFLQAGFGKWNDIPKVAEFFADVNIPIPLFHAYLVATVEFLGGILLIFGLFTRIVSIPLIILLVVAFWTAHREPLLDFWTNPSGIVTQSPFGFLLGMLILFIFGPGKLSIDEFLEKD